MKLTRNMLRFLELNMNEIVPDVAEEGKKITNDMFDKIFSILCNRMLESNDNEIKIELSRTLMYMGFREYIFTRNEAMDAFIKEMKDKGFDGITTTYGKGDD